MAQTATFVENIWYYAAIAPDFKPGQMKRVTIAGHPINLGQEKSGSFFALRDICPHRAAPLSAGRLIDGQVECPYHGWRFSAQSGQCDLIPSMCEGQKNPAEGIQVRSYPVKQSGNLIWVYISSDKKFSGEPDIAPPEFPSARFKPRLVERLTLNCHVDHAVVGLMDPAHGPYVHQQWWWRSQKSMHEKHKRFEPRERGFAMAAHTPSSNSLAYKILGGKPITEISFCLPGIRTEDIKIGEKSLLSFTAVTPIDETTTEITQMFFTDKLLIKILSPFLRSYVQAFLHQDGHMVDLQQKGLKYDPNLMLIDDADVQAKWYYAIKREWAKAQAEGRPFVNPVTAKTLKWRS